MNITQEEYIEGARDRLEQEAIKYARLKTMGVYVDSNGAIIRVSPSDLQSLVDCYKVNLLLAAENLLAEMSLRPLSVRKPGDKA